MFRFMRRPTGDNCASCGRGHTDLELLHTTSGRLTQLCDGCARKMAQDLLLFTCPPNDPPNDPPEKPAKPPIAAEYSTRLAAAIYRYKDLMKDFYRKSDGTFFPHRNLDREQRQVIIDEAMDFAGLDPMMEDIITHMYWYRPDDKKIGRPFVHWAWSVLKSAGLIRRDENDLHDELDTDLWYSIS